MLAPVLVTGVGRCGTSMVAGILDALGFDMGDSVPPDEHNPKGYFEDKDFVAVHEAVLQEHLLWNEAKQIMQALVVKRMQKKRPWGIKDPRLCYFSNFYIQILPYARWIICYRAADEVVKSYMATYLLDYDSCWKVMESRWQALNISLHSKAGIMVLHVNYEQALLYPKRLINALRVYLGLQSNAERETLALGCIEVGRDPAMTRPIPPPTDLHGLKELQRSITIPYGA